MKKLFLLLLFCTAATFAQQKKYQGLLWEVSGNGLTKKSYLYGSMHVSDKVSYHLSDAFFTHLMNADIVANESDPATWNELIDFFSTDFRYRNDKFYTGFYMIPYNKANLEDLFKNRNFTLNNILSRTSEFNKEYQEETYLDMFIYRTGRKYNKRTVGLEETKSSLLRAGSTDFSRSKPKEENKAALQKILKNVSYRDALVNYYREKDLDMLDSITVLSSSEEYLKALLYDRNIVMVKSIDSLARTGSLFAAVGAAHLPGKKGIIEMLRKKGYTVTPVHDQYTDKGKNRKEQIERYYTKPEYKQYTTADGMVTLPLYKMVIENKQDVQGPDLANGGYINIKRMLLKDYLTKDNRTFNHKSLDSLFYENIPGKILEKKFYTQDGYTVYDIKNITKTGNSQRYRYYISPLEIISISMAGEGTYTRQFENDVYNAISVKPITGAWKKASPKKGGFSVEMPAYTAVYGETAKQKTAQDINIYGYDTAEKANYFVLEKTLKDNETLEDTEFELKRIQYEFYRQLGIDSTATKMDRNPLGFTSSAKLGNKTVRLKTTMQGAKYYLLGSVGASEGKTETFFNSFAFVPAAQDEKYTTHTDSTANFSISIPKMQNEKLDYMQMAQEAMFKMVKNKGVSFDDDYKEFNFSMPSGQAVNVMYHKYAKYANTKVIDTLWSDVRKYYTGQYIPDGVDYNSMIDEEYFEDAAEIYSSNKKGMTNSTWFEMLLEGEPELKIINEKIYKEGDINIFEGQAVKADSEQALKFKVLNRNGITYSINVLTPKNYRNNDAAIEKAFTSFTLLEDKEKLLPDNKFRLFTEDASSAHDSIREGALDAISRLKLSKSDLPAVKTFLDTFTFKKEETRAQNQLYGLIGKIKDDSVIPLLEQQYKHEGNEATQQLAILEALATQESESAYKKILELLEYDLPVPQNHNGVSSLFNSFIMDTKNSAVLFPDVMQFYSVPEYHDPLIAFTSALVNDNAIKPKKLSGYKKMILTNARLELKREKSRAATSRYDNYNNGNLEDYAGLLHPFRKDKDVMPVLDAMRVLDNNDIKAQLLKLDIATSDVSEQQIKALLADEATLFITLSLIKDSKYAGLGKNVNDDSVAKSALLHFNKKDMENVTTTFLEKKTVPAGKHTATFYFYRLKEKSENEFYTNPDDLEAVAFINNKDGRINTEAYRYVDGEEIGDEEELQSSMATIIDMELNRYKTRATFGRLETNMDLSMDLFDE